MSDFFDDSDKYQLDFSICHISGQIPILTGQLKKQIKANKVNWNKQISASEPAGRRGGIGPRGAVSTQKTQPGNHNGDKAHLKMVNGEEMKRKVADVERDSTTRMKSDLQQRQRVIIVTEWDTGREYVGIAGQCTRSRMLRELSRAHISLVRHVTLLKRVNIGLCS